jgi:hypothetical protein
MGSSLMNVNQRYWKLRAMREDLFRVSSRYVLVIINQGSRHDNLTPD